MRKPKTFFEQVPLEIVRAHLQSPSGKPAIGDRNLTFEPPSAKTEPYSVPEGSLPRTRRPGRILLVDPDAATRLPHAEHLRRLTYDVEEASDGLEALARAVSNQPGVVVTESRLAGISAAELCRLLRCEPLTRSVAVILLAGATAGDDSSARATGVDVVMFKPCAPEHLASEIRTLLANATTREHETTDG